MAKKKKSKLRTEFNKSIRRTHRQKSNKLIYAVAGGLVLVLLIFILSSGGNGTPLNKEKLILETTEYLKKNKSITDIVAIPEENKAIVSYDVTLVEESQKKLDFKEMIRYASIRLSNELKNVDVQILLKEDNKKEKPYLVTAKDGKITGEKLLDQ